jgi:hypothetical protein
MASRFPGDVELILLIVGILMCGMIVFGVGNMVYQVGLWVVG